MGFQPVLHNSQAGSLLRQSANSILPNVDWDRSPGSDNFGHGNDHFVPCAAAYAALCRSGVHDLRVDTYPYFAVAAIAAENTRGIGPIRR